MGNYRYQVALKNISGLSEDNFTNTFYAVAPNDVDGITFATSIIQGYRDPVAGGPSALAVFLHKGVSRAALAHKVTVYDLGTPIPRIPIAIVPFTLGAPSDENMLPSEVASCLSFQALPIPGGIQARRRGRVYIGPFCFFALAAGGSNNDARPGPALIEAMINLGQHLMAAPTAEWSVHSTLSPVLLPVDNGWVDNAFDTQRRRGVDPSARNAFTALLP